MCKILLAETFSSKGKYRKTSDFSRTLVSNNILDHSDVDHLSALLQLHLHS